MRAHCVFLQSQDNGDPPEIISLPEAASLIASRPSLATLYRWISRGVKGKRLQSVAIGGRRMIRRGDLERFLAELNNCNNIDDLKTFGAEQENSGLVDKLLGKKPSTKINKNGGFT